MGKRPSTFGMSQEKLARIWGLGSEASAEGRAGEQADQRKAELLRDHLASSLRFDSELAQLLPGVLSRLCQELRPFVGESVGRLLLDPQTDLAVLERIKDQSKAAAESARSEAEHDAAIAVYYGAIAGALVHHGRRITSFSCEGLRESFASLLENQWLTAELADLMRKGEKHCLTEAGGSDRNG